MNIIGLLFFVLVNLYAQTPFFYYYQGERQYLELDTRYVFISISDESIMNSRAFSVPNARFEPLRTDIPERKRTRADQSRRYWSILSFEERLSNETYLTMLSEIRNLGSDLIVAPFFRDRYQSRIGLSNFFYVRLKDLSDTIAPQENQDVFSRHAASEQVFDIRLFNAHGMIVRQQRTQARTIQFDVSNLPEGTYYLHIEHGGEIEKHQIIVQRN